MDSPLGYSIVCLILLPSLVISNPAEVKLLPPVVDSAQSFHVTCDCRDFRDRVQRTVGVNNVQRWHVRFLAGGHEVKAVDLSKSEVNMCQVPLSFNEGIDKNMNKNYTCEMTAESTKRPQPIKSTSDSRFLGIRPVTNQIRVPEGQTKQVSIESTVPILCDHAFSCCLPLDLQIGTQRNQLATFTQCVYELCKKDWNTATHRAVIDVPVVANADGVTDGNSRLLVKFRPLIPAGGGDVHQIFENVKVEPVQVTVEDQPDATCGVGGDPHVVGFDKQMIHLLDVGDYTLYKNDEKDFEVHIRTWPCHLFGRIRRVSCTSGIVLRDGNDVIRLSISDDIPTSPRLFRMNRIQRLEYMLSHTRFTVRTDHRSLPDGTTVLKDGSAIVINFPSGVEISARAGKEFLDMMMKLPGTFRLDPHQRGLCGKMNHQTTHAHHNHNPNPHHNQHCQRFLTFPGCINNAFTQLWQINQSTTLFTNPPPSKPIRPQKNDVFCGCAQNQQMVANPVINCTNDGNKPPTKRNCANCKPYGNIPTGLYGGTFGPSTGKRDGASISWDPHQFMANNSNFTGPIVPPTPTPAEIAKAESECKAAMASSYLGSMCNISKLMGRYTDQCVMDYLLSGDDRFVKSALSGYNDQCLHHIESNPDNYVKKPDGTMAIKDSIMKTLSCSQECEEHGHCENGTCVCDRGYDGFHCDSNTTTSTGNQTSPSTSPANSQASSSASPTNSQASSSTSPTNSQASSSTSPTNSQASSSTSPTNSQASSSTSPTNSQASSSTSPTNSQASSSTSPTNSQASSSTSPTNSQASSSASPTNSQASSSASPPNSQISSSTSLPNSQTSSSTSPAHSQTSSSASPSNGQTSSSTSPPNSQTSSSTSLPNSQTSSSTSPANSQISSSTSLPNSQTSSSTSPAHSQTSSSASPSNGQTSSSTSPPNSQTSSSTSLPNSQTSSSTSPAHSQTSSSTSPASSQLSTTTASVIVASSSSGTQASASSATTKTMTTTPSSQQSHNTLIPAPAATGSNQTLTASTLLPVPSISHLTAILGYTQNGSRHGGDHCDVNGRHCDTVLVRLDTLDPFVTDVLCVLQYVKNGVPTVTTKLGSIKSKDEIECPLPTLTFGLDQGSPYEVVSVQVTSNKIDYSNALNFTIVDSQCVVVVNGTLDLVSQVCVIDDYCHSDGSLNALVDHERCVASKSTSHWTKVVDTPINAQTQTLVLTDPNDELKSSCKFDQVLKPSDVDWWVNGVKVKTQTPNPGDVSVTVDIFEIWGSGPPVSIECRMLTGTTDTTEYTSNLITIV